MKEKIINILKIVGFLAIGIFLFWLVYRDQDIDELISALNEINYSWIWLSLFLGIISHLSRALRWKILIKPLGYKIDTLSSFFAVMIGYLANLAIPRMGEVTRSGVISKYKKIPFTQLFGTSVLERGIDLLMLLLLTVIVLFSQFEVITQFITNNPEVSEKFNTVIYSKAFWIAFIALIIAGIALIFILRNTIRHTKFYKKTKNVILNFWEGIKTIRHIENKFAFIFHTFLIWALYFIMIYVCFFGFEATKQLSIMVGLTIFVMASYGMVAPVQGGIGPWHFMVISTMFIYGIDSADAKVFALVVHGITNLMIIVVGALSFILLPIINRKTAPNIEQ